MLRVIKYGNDVIVNNIKCEDCGSDIEYTSGDLTTEGNYRVIKAEDDKSFIANFIDYYVLVCPVCGKSNYIGDV